MNNHLSVWVQMSALCGPELRTLLRLSECGRGTAATPDTEETRSWAMGAQCIAVFIRIEAAAYFPGTGYHRKGGQIARDSFCPSQESLFYLLNDRC